MPPFHRYKIFNIVFTDIIILDIKIKKTAIETKNEEYMYIINIVFFLNIMN